MKASSESGECASLISTGSLSVFEAVCGPGMGLFVSFSGATLAGPDHFTRNREAAASPGLLFPRETFPRGGGSFGDELKKTCASQGLAWRWAGRFLARESLAYWCPANNWEPHGAHGEPRGRYLLRQRRAERERGRMPNKMAILLYSRVPSSRPLCGGFDLPLVFIDPRLREPIELV